MDKCEGVSPPQPHGPGNQQKETVCSGPRFPRARSLQQNRAAYRKEVTRSPCHFSLCQDDGVKSKSVPGRNQSLPLPASRDFKSTYNKAFAPSVTTDGLEPLGVPSCNSRVSLTDPTCKALIPGPPLYQHLERCPCRCCLTEHEGVPDEH